MAFSLGNIIKAAGTVTARALSPVVNTALGAANAVKSMFSAPQQTQAAQPKTSDALFSTAGNGGGGFTTNSALPQPILPQTQTPVSAGSVVLPRATTPLAPPSPSLMSAGQPALGPAPTIPSTIPNTIITSPNQGFVPVTTPAGPASLTTGFTSTSQTGVPTQPTTGGTVAGTGQSAQATTPGSPAIPDSLLNQTSDQSIRDAQGRIIDVSRQLQGRGAAQLAAEAKARIPEQQQDLNNVMAQINTLNQDALAEQIKIEGKPIASEFASRQIGAVERARTVKVLGLSAVASALQGNIALARDYATKSVDAQFKPMEDELATLQQQLEFNKDNFTRAEKARADKLSIALDERKRLLDEEKVKRGQISEIALEAAKNGADGDTINAIMNSTDLSSALGTARGALAKKNGVGLYNLSEAQANIASKLADDFEKASGQFSVVRDAYGRIQAAQQGNGISDTALIFSYMKLLDPGSVVREGEFATVENAGSIPENILNAYNKARNGQKIGALRDDILATSGALFAKAQQTQNNIVNQFNSRAQAYGIPTDLVTRDISAGISVTPTIGSSNVTRDQVFARLKAKYPNRSDADLNEVTDQYVANPSRISELGFTSDLGTSQNGLGGLSARYESSGSPGAIGYDSTGGWSYGTYQLAHNNALNFVQQSPYAREFQGLTFNSPEFRKRWQEVAARDPQGFGQAQHDFISKTHFAPQEQILSQGGIDVSTLSPVLQNVVWSTAVQHGPNTPIVLNAIKSVGPNASEADKIRAIYFARWNNGRNFASSTPAVQRAVYNRFFGPQGEMNTALALVNRGNMTA